MAKVGGGNPVPTEIGGGPSSSDLANSALKASVGVGGSAEDGTIEAAWRLARARGIRAAFCDDRAAMQFFPDRATDAIPVYEEMLDTAAAPNTSDEARRRAITAAWIKAVDAATPTLEESLQEIDPLLSIVTHDRDTATYTVLGRGFEDWNPADPDAVGPAFGGGRESSEWPNYSSAYNCIVQYAVAAGPITSTQRNVIERTKVLLNETLPAWVDFMFTKTLTGFVLDLDLLDLGSFGP